MKAPKKIGAISDRRDAGGNDPKSERLGGVLNNSSTAILHELHPLTCAPSAPVRSQIPLASLVQFQADWICRRYRLPPEFAALLAMHAFGEQGGGR